MWVPLTEEPLRRHAYVKLSIYEVNKLLIMEAVCARVGEVSEIERHSKNVSYHWNKLLKWYRKTSNVTRKTMALSRYMSIIYSIYWPYIHHYTCPLVCVLYCIHIIMSTIYTSIYMGVYTIHGPYCIYHIHYIGNVYSVYMVNNRYILNRMFIPRKSQPSHVITKILMSIVHGQTGKPSHHWVVDEDELTHLWAWYILL